MGLMLVHGPEPLPSGPELFTLRRDSFYEVTFSRAGRSEPAPVTGAAIIRRQHFGFPCYALIVDESSVGNLYAKLDMVRFTANSLVAAVASLFLLSILTLDSRERTKQQLAVVHLNRLLLRKFSARS